MEVCKSEYLFFYMNIISVLALREIPSIGIHIFLFFSAKIVIFEMPWIMNGKLLFFFFSDCDNLKFSSINKKRFSAVCRLR